MISLLLLIWTSLVSVFIGVPIVYYLYMRRRSLEPWSFKTDSDYYPSVTLLVPAHNEEAVIKLKLANLLKLRYPRNKFEIVVVNDASTDRTVDEVHEFKKSNPSITVGVLNSPERKGKTAALNLALKTAKGEIVVVSDADCFLASDTLENTVPFFADDSVGAISGLEMLLNPEESWVTESEILYNDTVHTLRVGESKAYSTLFFQGGFGAYRHSMLDRFDSEADDSGTALNVIQQGGRVILLPEAIYYTMFSSNWKGKFTVKLRRAVQLVRLWFRCGKMFLRRQLVLPKKIFLPESFLYLVNPFVFLLLIGFSVLAALENPLFLIILLGLIGGCLSFRKTRTIFVETVQDHLILLCAIVLAVSKRRFSLWSAASSRPVLSHEYLERRGLT